MKLRTGSSIYLILDFFFFLLYHNIVDKFFFINLKSRILRQKKEGAAFVSLTPLSLFFCSFRFCRLQDYCPPNNAAIFSANSSFVIACPPILTSSGVPIPSVTPGKFLPRSSTSSGTFPPK